MADLPERVKVLVAVPSYDGRVHSDVMLYLCGLGGALGDHPRIDRFQVVVECGYPCDRVRNLICAKALAAGFDFVLMIDDDMKPDVMVGIDPAAVPFLPAALDFALAQPTPVCVGAPYLSAPPRQDVLVMRWAERVPDTPDALGLDMRKYTREEAATLTGFARAAALPTGMLLIDLRCLAVVPKPWFAYEFDDADHTKLASTEDIVFTRNADWSGVPQFAAWSSWAGHHKRYLTHRPQVAPVEALPKALHKALANGWRPVPVEE